MRIVSPITLRKRFAARFQPAADFTFIKKITARFPAAKLYLVGGLVRDTIRGNTQGKDYDFVIQHVTTDELISVLKPLGYVDVVGRTFGVIKFMPRKCSFTEAIDIALPRTEQPLGTGGYRDVTTQSDPSLSIADDLSRRDLTINALAWDLTTQELVDPFNGLADIRDNVIRCVGEPAVRFQEDYSRMLRAIRFACQFDAMIADTTWAALQTLMPHLRDQRIRGTKTEQVVPWEIITRELTKACSYAPMQAFDLLVESNALPILFPHLTELQKQPHAWDKLRSMISAIESDAFTQLFPDAAPASIIFSLIVTSLPRRNHTTRSYQRALNALGNTMRLSHDESALISKLPEYTTRLFDHPRLVTLEILALPPISELLLPYAYLQTVAEDNHAAFTTLQKQILPLTRLQKKFRGTLPPQLLSGEKIMHILHLSHGGKIIALAKDQIREAQLRGEISTATEASRWLQLHPLTNQ